jgi:hypothetical protein
MPIDAESAKHFCQKIPIATSHLVIVRALFSKGQRSFIYIYASEYLILIDISRDIMMYIKDMANPELLSPVPPPCRLYHAAHRRSLDISCCAG